MNTKYIAILESEGVINEFKTIQGRTNFILINDIKKGLCYLVDKETKKRLMDSIYRFNSVAEGVTSLCCNQLENRWEVRLRANKNIIFTGDLEGCKKFLGGFLNE